MGNAPFKIFGLVLLFAFPSFAGPRGADRTAAQRERDIYLENQNRIGAEIDIPNELPNLFLPERSRALALQTVPLTAAESEILEADITEALRLENAALGSLFRRMTVGLVPAGEVHARPLPYFDYLQEKISALEPGVVALPSAGLVRSARGYLYKQMVKGLLSHSPSTPWETLERIANEDKHPLAAIEVRGVKSDLDIWLRRVDGQPIAQLQSIQDFIRKLTYSAKDQYGSSQREAVSDAIFERPDSKVYSDQVTLSVSQGGSTVDFLAYDPLKKKMVPPPQLPHLDRDIVAGVADYIAPTGPSLNPLKQLVRLGRARMDTPWIRLKSESRALKEIEDFSKAFNEGKVEVNSPDFIKAVAQFDKMLINSLEAGGRNRYHRAAADSLDGRYMALAQKIAKAAGISRPLIPEYADHRPLVPGGKPAMRSLRLPPQFVVPIENFLETRTAAGANGVKGWLFHGTPRLALAYAILKQGIFLSKAGQGYAFYGRGAYTSPHFNVAGGFAHYSGSDGLVLRLKVRSDLPLVILDWEKALKTQDPFIKQIEQEAASKGTDAFTLLSREYGVDIIINNHVLIQNASAVEFPHGITGLAQSIAYDMRHQVQAKDVSLHSVWNQFKEYQRLHTFFLHSGELTPDLISPQQLSEELLSHVNSMEVKLRFAYSMVEEKLTQSPNWEMLKNDLLAKAAQELQSLTPRNSDLTRVTVLHGAYESFYNRLKPLGQITAASPTPRVLFNHIVKYPDWALVPFMSFVQGTGFRDGAYQIEDKETFQKNLSRKWETEFNRAHLASAPTGWWASTVSKVRGKLLNRTDIDVALRTLSRYHYLIEGLRETSELHPSLLPPERYLDRVLGFRELPGDILLDWMRDPGAREIFEKSPLANKSHARLRTDFRKRWVEGKEPYRSKLEYFIDLRDPEDARLLSDLHKSQREHGWPTSEVTRTAMALFLKEPVLYAKNPALPLPQEIWRTEFKVDPHGDISVDRGLFLPENRDDMRPRHPMLGNLGERMKSFDTMTAEDRALVEVLVDRGHESLISALYQSKDPKHSEWIFNRLANSPQQAMGYLLSWGGADKGSLGKRLARIPAWRAYLREHLSKLPTDGASNSLGSGVHSYLTLFPHYPWDPSNSVDMDFLNAVAMDPQTHYEIRNLALKHLESLDRQSPALIIHRFVRGDLSESARSDYHWKAVQPLIASLSPEQKEVFIQELVQPLNPGDHHHSKATSNRWHRIRTALEVAPADEKVQAAAVDYLKDYESIRILVGVLKKHPLSVSVAKEYLKTIVENPYQYDNHWIYYQGEEIAPVLRALVQKHPELGDEALSLLASAGPDSAKFLTRMLSDAYQVSEKSEPLLVRLLESPQTPAREFAYQQLKSHPPQGDASYWALFELAANNHLASSLVLTHPAGIKKDSALWERLKSGSDEVRLIAFKQLMKNTPAHDVDRLLGLIHWAANEIAQGVTPRPGESAYGTQNRAEYRKSNLIQTIRLQQERWTTEEYIQIAKALHPVLQPHLSEHTDPRYKEQYWADVSHRMASEKSLCDKALASLAKPK